MRRQRQIDLEKLHDARRPDLTTTFSALAEEDEEPTDAYISVRLMSQMDYLIAVSLIGWDGDENDLYPLMLLRAGGEQYIGIEWMTPGVPPSCRCCAGAVLATGQQPTDTTVDV